MLTDWAFKLLTWSKISALLTGHRRISVSFRTHICKITLIETFTSILDYNKQCVHEACQLLDTTYTFIMHCCKKSYACAGLALTPEMNKSQLAPTPFHSRLPTSRLSTIQRARKYKRSQTYIKSAIVDMRIVYKMERHNWSLLASQLYHALAVSSASAIILLIIGPSK